MRRQRTEVGEQTILMQWHYEGRVVGRKGKGINHQEAEVEAQALDGLATPRVAAFTVVHIHSLHVVETYL